MTVPYPVEGYQLFIPYRRRSLMNKHPARRGPGCISQLVDSTYYYFEFYKTVGLGVGKEWSPPLPLKKQLVKIIIWK